MLKFLLSHRHFLTALFFVTALPLDLRCESARAQEVHDDVEPKPDDDEGGFSILKRAPDLREIRKEISEWDQSVRGFRKEHHFTLLTGYMGGVWQFKRFGTQINKRHRDKGLVLKFHYSYHIPIYKSFGYYLGSSTGVWIPTEESKHASVFSAAMLPGILGGLCYNFNPGLRLIAGMDYYLERWNRLHEKDGIGDDPYISVTARSTDLLVAMDVFYRLKWAVRLEGHKRRLDFTGTKKGNGKPVDAVIARDDEFYALGFLYHLM